MYLLSKHTICVQNKQEEETRETAAMCKASATIKIPGTAVVYSPGIRED